ncbi:hypothetical protein PG987_004271, partial [Apiospora arundinis]
TKSRLQKKYRQPDVDTDRLYRTDVTHPLDDASYATSCSADTSALVMRRARGEDDDNPAVHYGLIASVNQLMKNAVVRDKLAREKGVLCFEMETAGLTNHFPCLVIRGICDYSDTHKNKEWQGYAAMTAAADIKYGVEELQADGHLDKIRRWLSPLDPSTNLNKAREQHCRGTGQWFLDSDQYFKWKTDRHPFLWLNGIPGCGKTIFSSSVVADLEQSTASESLIYFYFGFNNIEKQSLEKAVRSLIAQLYYKRKDTRADVDTLYRSYMLQRVGEVWLILDALDECHLQDDSFANGLLLWIKRIRESGVNVHMLVTSRPEYDIKAAIEGWACDDEIIPLQSSLVEADIEAYIKVRINQVDEWRARPDIQKEIENTLVQKANGILLRTAATARRGCRRACSGRQQPAASPDLTQQTEYLTSGRLEGNIANELQETAARLNIVIVCLSYLLDMGYPYTELLETGAEINAQGGHYGNALQAASFQGHEAIVRLMLEKGADWTAPTQSELMPLHASLRYGHVSVIQLLLNKDSESCKEDNLGRSLLFYAIQGGLEAFDLVRDRQMHINKTDHYGSTLLSVAVRYGHEELVNQLLVIPDIYCTLKDNFGRSALWWARRQGYVGIEGRLLEYTKTQGFDIGILVETNEPAEFSIESRL